jgi:hypothetical protein
MSAVLKKIEENISVLPPQMQAEVVDFAVFLREKWEKQNKAENVQSKERVLGMYEGQGWISDDFDDELPDEFWWGDDFDERNKDESAP